MTPKEYLKSLGWSPGDPNLIMEDPHHDYQVWCWECTGSENGWELFRFTDSDINGVATGRFVTTGKEGDTLHELQHALADLNLIDPVKFRVEELLEILNGKARHYQDQALVAALATYIKETSGKPPL